MTPPGWREAVWVLAGLAGIGEAGTAQAAANRAIAYLTPSDITDVRALWVNPGGLAVRREASVMLDLTVTQPGTHGRLGQVTTGFDARGLGFGYQRDNFTDGTHAHAYRIGVGGASGRLAAGLALALHRGASRGTGWDFGARYDWRPELTLAGAVRDVGRPTVRGVRRDVMVVPAITLRPMGGHLALSAQSTVVSSATRGYGFQADVELRRPLLGFIARLDTDRSLRRSAFAVGVSIGRADRVGTVWSTTDFSDLQAASVYGVSSRTPAR